MINQRAMIELLCEECGLSTVSHKKSPLLEKFRQLHANCGKPKEPACPLRRTGITWVRPESPMFSYCRATAVAIAFQYAVENGMIRVTNRYPHTYYTHPKDNSIAEHTSPAEAVKAVWPKTFEDVQS